MITRGEDAELSAIKNIAEMMCVAARTAPKACGTDNLDILLIEGGIKDKISNELKRICKETGIGFFGRDALCVEASPVLFMIGTRFAPINCPKCGYCGFKDCAENKANKGICFFNSNDLGIAVGSAASVAADHRVDNRILFSAGRAALNLGIFPGNVKAVFGIPLSSSGKSPFFDRADCDPESI